MVPDAPPHAAGAAALGPVTDPGPQRRRTSGRAGAAGLLAAAFTAAGSVVLALVMGSPMFLVIGLVGVLASTGMWLAGRIGAAREGRRSRAGGRGTWPRSPPPSATSAPPGCVTTWRPRRASPTP